MLYSLFCFTFLGWHSFCELCLLILPCGVSFACVVWLLIMSSSSTGLSPPGFHILPERSSAPDLYWGQTKWRWAYRMYLPWVTEVHCSNCARCHRPFTGLEKLSALILNLAFLHYKGLNFPPARGRGWKFSFLTEAYPSPLHPASCTAQAASLTTLWASGGHFC